MPVRLVEFHPLAEREIESAERWYRRRSPSSAQRLLQAVDETVQRIASAAELGSPYLQQIRWMGGEAVLLSDLLRNPRSAADFYLCTRPHQPPPWLLASASATLSHCRFPLSPS